MKLLSDREKAMLVEVTLGGAEASPDSKNWCYADDAIRIGVETNSGNWVCSRSKEHDGIHIAHSFGSKGTPGLPQFAWEADTP